METKYYLSVSKNKEYVIDKKPFVDFSLAVEACSHFYKSKSENSILIFTSEMVDGMVIRSYAELLLPDDVDPQDGRYAQAAKHSNIFDYSASYFFLIEVDA